MRSFPRQHLLPVTFVSHLRPAMSTISLVKDDPEKPRISHKGRRNIPVAASNVKVDPDRPKFVPFNIADRGFLPQDSPLNILMIDMLKESNSKEHHTDKFFDSDLIVRRGQQFRIQITFDRDYQQSKEEVQLEFCIGATPHVSTGTAVTVTFNQEQEGSWLGKLLENTGRTLLMGVTPPAECIVGKFRMYVVSLTLAGLSRYKDSARDVYILFNPWASADAVFMPDDNEREECVLNQDGIIYNGDENNVTQRPWNYGQFEEGILNACLYVLDNASIPITNRGNPIYVVRTASAKINSLDDDGVMVGNWSGNYKFGKDPSSWLGSVEILRRYAKNGVPVCFAQCSIFAAIFSTVLRCLGIAARVITNFNSAHDNDGNLKTDLILNEKGNVDPKHTRDSIWNYHCWTECYMTRPDLPKGFGGWQTVDATPQETSDGLFRCGPASVNAIKQGMTCLPYDTLFIFSEVNSDIIYHKLNKDGTLKQVDIDKSRVGKMLLTKEVGQNESRDVTSTYKYPEGSEEEQSSMAKAVELGCVRYQTPFPKAEVQMVMTVMDAKVGDDFQLTLDIKNLSSVLQKVDFFVSGSVVFYTGVLSSEFMNTNRSLTLDPFKSLKSVVEVRAEDYLSQLLEQASLSFTVMGYIEATEQNLVGMHVMNLRPPNLTVKVTGNPKVKQVMLATVEFRNLFRFELKNVTISLKGLELILPRTKQYSGIEPNNLVMWTESFIPESPGKKTLIACLASANATQACGQADVDIQP